MPPAIAQPPADPSPSRASRRYIGLIWGICLLLTAGIWWFVAAQTQFEHRQAVDDAIRQNVNRSIAFEQYVRRTLEAADLVTRYVGGRFARGAAGGEFAGARGRPATITGSVARSGTFLSVSIVDPEGDVVATSITRWLPRFNLAEHPAFRTHLVNDDGRLHVSRPIFAPLVGQNVIWLTRRLNRPDGGFAGIIAVNILPDQFVSFYRDAQVSEMDVMLVIGLDGIIRARRTGGVTQSGQDVRGRTPMQQQRLDPNGTHLGESVFDRQTRYYSHRRLSDYGLFVTYGVLEADILALSRARARLFIVTGILASLLLAGLAAFLTFYFSRRNQREAEMARANRRLQQAQKVAQIGDWDYDLRTGETFWSPQLLAMYERDSMPTFEEFLGYLDKEGRVAVARAHAEAIRTHEPQEVEYSVRLPTGAETHHQSAVIPAFDAGGNVVRLHGVDQNISARKLLDRLQTHVAHLSRVEAMNAMAATLAHELNQPLTAASNYLAGSRRILKSGPAAEVERGMAAAEQQVHLAADIIRRVREMVANQPKAVMSVSIARAVDDAVALLAVPRLFPRLTLRKDIAADARGVNADRVQLQQVLMNLIRNAGDATEDAPAPEIVISSRRAEAGHVVIRITDNGTGFAQAAEDRFSPFASTKHQGLGLGLSISRTIIEAHGGRIWIDEGDGDGASVCFTLPAAKRQGSV